MARINFQISFQIAGEAIQVFDFIVLKAGQQTPRRGSEQSRCGSNSHKTNTGSCDPRVYEKSSSIHEKYFEFELKCKCRSQAACVVYFKPVSQKTRLQS
jgi:hypothetical protein